MCVKCERCGLFFEEDDCYELNGKMVCEDCYMYLTNPPQACDPLAVASALSVRKQMGQEGAEGLTQIQKKIYDLIAKKGKITREELAAQVGLKPQELESEFAILRHCELIRAFKEGSQIYVTKW